MSQHKRVSQQSLGSGTPNSSRQFLLLARRNRKSLQLAMPRTEENTSRQFLLFARRNRTSSPLPMPRTPRTGQNISRLFSPVSMSQQEKPRTRAKYFQTASPVSTSQQEKPRTTSVELISHHSARMHIIPVCTLFPGITHQRREYTSADAHPIPM